MAKLRVHHRIPSSATGFSMTPTRWLILMLGIVVISRFLAWAAGVEYYTFSRSHEPQLIDPAYLTGDLLRSVFYHHIQPPLFNLSLGIAMKIAPDHYGVLLQVVYLGLGAIMAVSLYSLMRRLGVPAWFGAMTTAFFMIAPETILFEHLMLYSYPVVALLAAAALLFHRYLDAGRFRDGIGFFGILAAVVLIRSLFHLVWLLFFVIATLGLRRDIWRRTLLAALVPLMLVIAVYAKNQVVFGHFAASTWSGFSLSKITTSMLSEDERLALAEEGELSELAFISPFTGLWRYYDYTAPPVFTRTGIPVLDLELNPNRSNNFNCLAYLGMEKRYVADAKAVLRHHPEAYARGVKKAVRIYLFPASDWFYSYHSGRSDNVLKLGWYEKGWNTLVHGQVLNRILPGPLRTFQKYESLDNWWNIGLFIPFALIVALVYGIYDIIRCLCHPDHRARLGALVFLTATVIYITLVSNLMEVGENNRFRFNTEPLVTVLITLALAGPAAKLAARWTGKGSSTSPAPKGRRNG